MVEWMKHLLSLRRYSYSKMYFSLFTLNSIFFIRSFICVYFNVSVMSLRFLSFHRSPYYSVFVAYVTFGDTFLNGCLHKVSLIHLLNQNTISNTNNILSSFYRHSFYSLYAHTSTFIRHNHSIYTFRASLSFSYKVSNDNLDAKFSGFFYFFLFHSVCLFLRRRKSPTERRM